MATKRQKRALVSNVTEEQLHEALAEYATADAKMEKIQSTMDVQITKIREKYADQLSDLQDKRDTNFSITQVWAQENPDRFEKKKSLETAYGKIGFRTGTPKLKTEKGFTWAAILKLLKVKLPDYVRTKEEPNKEKILADRNEPEVKILLPEVGIKVDADETFYIELKKEEADV